MMSRLLWLLPLALAAACTTRGSKPRAPKARGATPALPAPPPDDGAPLKVPAKLPGAAVALAERCGRGLPVPRDEALSAAVAANSGFALALLKPPCA